MVGFYKKQTLGESSALIGSVGRLSLLLLFVGLVIVAKEPAVEFDCFFFPLFSLSMIIKDMSCVGGKRAAFLCEVERSQRPLSSTTATSAMQLINLSKASK